MKAARILEIQNLVADYYGVSRDDLLSMRRKHPITRARKVAMFLCWRFGRTSKSLVGLNFGGRPGEAVSKAVRWVDEGMELEPSLNRELVQMMARIDGR